uniref:Aminotransferase class-III n=1 Tax=Megaviridae environmental sample TaxID=1737588 RepID=A0A5J6VML0_9VIRU|nr:MAG: aminotransferase class-III [Megaviridae environmental sample]
MLKNSIKTLIPWVKQYPVNQIKITSANGCLIQSNKKKIVDFTSGAMVVNLGHNNKYILSKIKKHINTGISYVPSNFGTYERNRLSERIIDIVDSNNFDKVLYTNAGADANESAMFLSREFFRFQNDINRTRILSFKKSFHGGSTIGASCISGDNRTTIKKSYFNLGFESIIENPKIDDLGSESLKNFETEFKKNNVASILIEGSSGSAGCILYPNDYLNKLKKLCENYGVILICDEVMSGWGRTGKMFGFQHSNIKPDIITTAKAITSGYAPLGAVILSKNIAEVFNENPVQVGLTYSGHILSTTIANSCLDLYSHNNYEILDNVNKLSKIIEYKCSKIATNCNFIKEFRGNGMLSCFELLLNDNELIHFSNYLLDNDIYCMRIRSNIFIAPPLVIDEDLLIATLNKIELLCSAYDK